MNLAIFDLDHTLLAGDSDNEWPKYLMKRGIVDNAYVEKKNDKFYRDYQAGCLNIDEFLAFQLAPLARFSRSELNAMHEEYMRDHIAPMMTQKAHELVQKHRDAGDELLVISATNEFIIAPIAHAYGIDNVIGVTLETDSKGDYTGRYVGTPSFKEGKITRLREWLAARGQRLEDFAEVYFYSDSHNDLPLLKLATKPVAVNPDATLRQAAQAAGWPIIELY